MEGKREKESGNRTVSSSLSHLASSPITISVHARTEVDNDRILLRDVADLSGEPKTVASLGRIDLGETPVLGGRRSLSRWNIAAALRDAGLAADDYALRLPPDVTIARKGQTVDSKTILDAAFAEAKRASGGAEPTPAPGLFVAPVLAPMGELKIETTATPNGERLGVTVTLRVDGKSVWSHDLAYKVKLEGVRAGDAVRVYVACGGAAIETDAKAKTGGVLGDAIQIVTSDGTLITATVTGTGKAEVKL